MKTNWPALRFGYLLVAGAALTAFPAQAQQARNAVESPALTTPASITAVQVAQADEQTTVRITGSRELRYQASRLENPARLVLDFAGTRLVTPRNAITSQYLPVRDVRMGQSGTDQTRVVIDLASASAYTVRADGSNVNVVFGTASAAAPVSTGNHANAKHPRSEQSAAIPAMPLPSGLTGTGPTFGRPAAQPAAPQPQSNAVVAQSMPAAVPQRQASPMSDRKYTGEPISVNLKDVDLKDFFRLIHEISGLNVVLDPAVKGTVTLVLDEVPWDQGLDIVLRNNGLSKEIDGNVLRIATQDTLKHEAEAQRDLAKAQTDAIDTVTDTRVLSYAKADLLKVTLKKFLSPRGDILADTRSNTLIISDIPSSMPKIDNLIRQLDRKSQQVEIEARVVAATRSFAREIGTQFGIATTLGNTVIGGLTGGAGFTSPISRPGPPFSPPPLIVAGTGTNPAIPLNTALGAIAPTSGISFLTQGRNYAIDFLLSLMEARGVGKVLSEPKGITQNNEKLTVKQGTKIPIQTTVNNTVSVQYIDAVLKLEVTPQITSDGTVFLDVTVENTQIDQGIPRIQGTPALDTQSTETKVLVTDGGTVVIGGVVTSSQRTDIDQVPLLGSIPIIGNLFKHTSVNVQSQELIFFVTPRILPG